MTKLPYCYHGDLNCSYNFCMCLLTILFTVTVLNVIIIIVNFSMIKGNMNILICCVNYCVIVMKVLVSCKFLYKRILHCGKK